MGFIEVWERVRAATGIDTFVKLATDVGVRQSAVSNEDQRRVSTQMDLHRCPQAWTFHRLAGGGPRSEAPPSPRALAKVR